jgi:hypothetical protein
MTLYFVFWESDRHFVVLGRASSLTDDVHVAACRQDHIPVLRRASGGGTILQGPSYAFVLQQAIADAWHAHVGLEAWPQTRMPRAMAQVVERSHPHEAEQATSAFRMAVLLQ